MEHINDAFPQLAEWFAYLRGEHPNQSIIEDLELNPDTGVYEPKHKQ